MLQDVLIKGLATGIAIVVVMAAIALFRIFVSGGVSRSSSGRVELRITKTIRAILLMSTVVFSLMLIGVLASDHENENGLYIGVGICLFFVLMSLPSFIWAHRMRISLTQEYIEKKYTFGKILRISWVNVNRIQNKHWSANLYVMDKWDWMSISHHTDGIEIVIQEIRNRIDPEVYRDELDKPLNNQIHIG